MGDQLRYKCRSVAGGTLTILAGNTSSNASTRQLNSMASFVTSYGASGGMLTLSGWYERYKMYGLKIKQTFWPLAPNSQPICGFSMASANSTFATAGIADTPEQRWKRYKVLTFPGQGTRPTTITSYYNCEKVWGDKNSFESSNLEATLNVVAPHFNTPVVGPFYQLGIFTLNGTAAAANIDCDFKIEATAYLRCWGRREQNL